MKKLGLLIAPLMIVSFLTNCTTKEITFKIFFDANGGYFDNDPTITRKVIKVKKGEIPDEPAHPTKPYEEANETLMYTFNSWDEKITPALETKIYYATYTLDTYCEVTFNTDGGSFIEPALVKKGAKLKKPVDPTKDASAKYTYDFDKWEKEGSEYNFNDPVTSDFTLKATYTAYAKGFKVTATDDTHLKFSKGGVPIAGLPVKADEDFKFQMKLTDDAPDTFTVPSTLKITVNGREPILPDFLEIQKTDDQKEADVTIKGKIIAGDIKISGQPAKADLYTFNIYKHDKLNYDSNADDKMRQEISKGKNLEVTFSTEEYDLPEAKNIRVYFDKDNKWVVPTEGSKDYCTYNGDKLTINCSKVDTYVMIVARSPDYPLLDKLSWNEINWLSTTYPEMVDGFLYVGEEKTVKVNNLDHKVRIIDFNHDDLADNSGKAHITFEFENVITDSNGKAATTRWNYKDRENSTNYNFPISTLNDLLNKTVEHDCVFNKLPEELKKAIKEVSKKVGISTDEGDTYLATNYSTKLFPLAYCEINTESPQFITDDEGYLYQYYDDHQDPEDLIKKKVGADVEENKENYWLRSPHTGSEIPAWMIGKTGHFATNSIYANALAVAPAFCI